MSVHFICDDYETLTTISSGSVNIFLSLTSLVEKELHGLNSGFSSIQSDEILIDKNDFIVFVNKFFQLAEHNGKFEYFAIWAEVIAGLYEKMTQESPERKMLNVKHFKPRNV